MALWDMKDGFTLLSQRTRMRLAMGFAIIADALQLIGWPLLVEGAASPADDLLDVAMAGAMGFLLGWHWEFLPSFAAKLVPGVDLVPLWSLAVANVWRKSLRSGKEPVTIEGDKTGFRG